MQVAWEIGNQSSSSNHLQELEWTKDLVAVEMPVKSTDLELLKVRKIPIIQVRIRLFRINNLDQVQQKDFKVHPSNN